MRRVGAWPVCPVLSLRRRSRNGFFTTDPGVRQTAIDALGILLETRYRAPVELLEDGSEAEMEAASVALGALKAESAVEPLHRIRRQPTAFGLGRKTASDLLRCAPPGPSGRSDSRPPRATASAPSRTTRPFSSATWPPPRSKPSNMAPPATPGRPVPGRSSASPPRSANPFLPGCASRRSCGGAARGTVSSPRA